MISFPQARGLWQMDVGVMALQAWPTQGTSPAAEYQRSLELAQATEDLGF